MPNKKTVSFDRGRNFQAPDIAKYRPLHSEDKSILASLSKTFTRFGVLGRGEEVRMEAEASFSTILREAQRGAKYENELNPDFYDPEAERLARLREEEDGDFFDNPSLDGVDDYGRQVYDNSVGDPTAGSFSPGNRSTIDSLRDTFGEAAIQSPFKEGIFNKSVDAKPFDRIDFKVPPPQASEPPAYKEINPLQEDYTPIEVSQEKIALYERMLSQARIPNG